MKKHYFLQRLIFFVIISFKLVNLNAQTGLNFQGVARTSNNVILASQAISIKLSILQGSATGKAEYTEIRKVNTNAQGLFTAVIGDTGATSTLGNFTTINWRATPKFLKIEMDPAAGSNFVTMGTTQFQYVAYAQFAKSVDADNIIGIVPASLGGTGVNSLDGLKTALAIDKINNTTDLTKPISTAMQTKLDLKLDKSDTSKYTKQNYTDSVLSTKLNITGNAASATMATSAGSATTATKLANAKNINGVAFDGSADITLTADAGTLIGTTLKSTVTASSLTSLGTLTNLTVTNPIVGSITGNAATASTATNAGTATTASKLTTSRNINGVAFDGSGDITITLTADAGTLTGTTLKSTVTASSLTSVGTLTNTMINGKLVVGASSAASASALLEANSTSQGFLPPRMTKSQRDAINSPSAGLMIWNNSNLQIEVYNGTVWVNMSGQTDQQLSIGQIYQGGIIAYISQSGDAGYDANTQHGLIAAATDQSTGIQWFNGSSKNILTNSVYLGGLENTNKIIELQGAISTDYAAGIARAYRGGGYTDWYLPNIVELNIVFLNKTAIGGFANKNYWSSSQSGSNALAWHQDFSDGVDPLGIKATSGKHLTYAVRAIRAF